MRFPYLSTLAVLCSLLPAIAMAADGVDAALSVVPAEIKLHGPRAAQQLLVTENLEGRSIDWTRTAAFDSTAPDIVYVDESGIVRPVGDGSAQIHVVADGRDAVVPVMVSGVGRATPAKFELDVMPILTRYGCNSGPCHGKQRGQNGFQLSLLGFDPIFDHDALTRESRGRRVFQAAPRRSLLLQKPTGAVPHGGGVRFAADDTSYDTLLEWIEAGALPSDPAAPSLASIEVEPRERIVTQNASQQLVVTAKYSDGSTRDVTRLATYQSNESGIAEVDDSGLVSTSSVVGDVAVMARYMDQIAVSNLAVPRSGEVPAALYADLPRQNFIDGHVWAKLERLGITPSEKAPDAKFLRRAYLDIIGRPPTVEEARAFLDDASADKRTALVDRLLERPEFADFWANKWVDLLRPNPYRVGIKSVFNYDAWIRDSFRRNQPYNEFVRELITAKGSTFRNGNVTMFRDRRDPAELTTITSQLFLGIRLECAKCHHHPFEVWGQDDFYGFAAYFAQIGRKGTGLSPPISGSEEMVFSAAIENVTHPLTGQVMEPKPLIGTARQPAAGEDLRDVLAEWMTSDDNPYFARVMVNRVWADLMGRGLVEPVDDLRSTNPPTNEALLADLARDFREAGYDLKHLVRSIATSYVYSLSSLPNDSNIADSSNYSRHYRRRLRAESLLDASVAITRIPERFDAMPPGSNATQIWTHRIESLFLDTFGRPDRNQDPPCERTSDTSMVQALHLMNSEDLYRKVTSDEGRAAELAKSDKTADEITTELYLAVYSRYPDAEELDIARGLLQRDGANRRECVEDLMWALMNTPEFVFKD